MLILVEVISLRMLTQRAELHHKLTLLPENSRAGSIPDTGAKIIVFHVFFIKKAATRAASLNSLLLH
jgi:hypothetical protein